MRTRLVALLGGVVAALALTLALLLLNPPAQTNPALLLREGDITEIISVNIQNTHGAYTVTAKDGGYEVFDIPAPLVDYERFLLLMNDCATLKALRVVDENPTDLALFGLDKPQATLHVEYLRGAPFDLRIGNTEPVSGNVYAEHGGRVYLIKQPYAQSYLNPARALISPYVTEPLALSSPLSAVLDATFTGGPLAQPVVLQAVVSTNEDLVREATSFGAASHLVRVGNDTFELDQTYGVEVLGSLLGIQAQDIVAYNCTAEQFAEHGFNKPWMQVAFQLMNNTEGKVQNLQLTIVKQAEDQYLMRRGEEDVIYQVGSLPFLGIDPGPLMMRWYLSPLILDLDSVSVTLPETTLDFQISGEANADKQATLNGQPMEIETFRKFYRLLTSASHDGALLDAPAPTGQPLLTVQYTYLDKAKQPDLIQFYAADARKIIVVLNGNMVEYGLREMYVTRLLEAATALQTGTDFEENW